MFPGAPKTTKKGWNCIGFIRPGASGPRGTKKREKLRKPRKIFCVCDGNSDFHAKSWEFRKKHHFALSRNVGIPCKILCIFKSAPPFPRAPLHFNEINGFLAKRSVLGQKKHFWDPNAPFWAPCSKPFINTSFWEVFWWPRTGKVQLFTKKAKFRAKMRISAKKRFSAQKVRFPQNGGKPPKTLPFLL